LEGAGGLLVAGAVAVAVAFPPTVAQGTPAERCGALDRPGSADDLGRDDGSNGGTPDPGAVPGDGERSRDTTCHERERCSAEESEEYSEQTLSPAGDEASSGADRGGDLWTGAPDERGADDQARARGDGPSAGGPPCPDSGGPRQSDGESDGGDQVLETRTARANGAADGSDRKSSESGGSDGERSADSGRSPATAQKTGGERSSAESMSESRRSGAGQYEPEAPPEAGGGSSSGSGTGDSSSSGSGSGDDDSGGDLPDTGFAAAALGATGLVLLLGGALGRRRLPVRGDD
jgi:hypothetical protein